MGSASQHKIAQSLTQCAAHLMLHKRRHLYASVFAMPCLSSQDARPRASLALVIELAILVALASVAVQL
jgi:hypothetical protein